MSTLLTLISHFTERVPVDWSLFRAHRLRCDLEEGKIRVGKRTSYAGHSSCYEVRSLKVVLLKVVGVVDT